MKLLEVSRHGQSGRDVELISPKPPFSKVDSFALNHIGHNSIGLRLAGRQAMLRNVAAALLRVGTRSKTWSISLTVCTKWVSSYSVYLRNL